MSRPTKAQVAEREHRKLLKKRLKDRREKMAKKAKNRQRYERTKELRAQRAADKAEQDRLWIEQEPIRKAEHERQEAERAANPSKLNDWHDKDVPFHPLDHMTPEDNLSPPMSFMLAN
jgi:hypothetical protein